MAVKSSKFDTSHDVKAEPTIAELLKTWRDAKGMTQKDCAKYLGFSPQTLSDLENGRRIPAPKRMQHLAFKLDLPETYLVAVAIRDALRSEGLHYNVKLEAA